ncbi:MAG: chemotaxis protein CheX [Phycisphaerales bacterium]|nr:chemotaxis protein CheX [Phycisphaerales bacterium]
MNVAYINPFVEAVDNVFRTMIDVPTTRKSVRMSSENGTGVSLTAIIGITGEFGGVVVLRFPPTTALATAGKMLGTTLTDSASPEVTDAIAELANMVAGSAKAKFEQDPPLQLGLPTVVHGSNYRVRYPTRSIWLEVPFESAIGDFALELTFGSA